MKQVFSRILLLGFILLPIHAPAQQATQENGKRPGLALQPELEDLRRLQDQTRAVVEQCLPSTVAILNGLGTGSGVLVSGDGLVLTAAHVVERSNEVQVVFPNGTETTGKVLGANYTRDIAMVKLNGPGPWPKVNIGNSTHLQPGDWVVALGHAKGYDPNRQPPLRFARILQNSKRGFLLSDCTLIGGDSGGPLFNLKGELVGIHSSIGNNLSINNHAPVNAFQKDWDKLVASKRWGELGRHPLTDPDSPVLGIGMELRRRGVGVSEVFRNSPAARAGLLPGDTLLALNGKKLDDAGDLLRELSKHEAEEVVTLTLLRNGRTEEVSLTLQRRADVFPIPE